MVVAIPFLVIATLAGGADAATIAVPLFVLILEVGIIAAIGVALSGVMARPLFSVATTYLVVAALSSLAAEGTVSGDVVAQAIEKYGIDPDRPDPAHA